MRRIILVAAALIQSACVMSIPTPSEPPICRTPGECEAAWAAARRWVLDHAGFKIQTYSSDYMETYNPTDASPQLAAEVSKEPIGNGAYTINARFWCANIFGCVQDPAAAQSAFNSDVSARIAMERASHAESK